MFDRFVADLLTTYLGEYFDNIDREQVKVSVWNGEVHLRNLKVRRDALRFFDVPICVLMGTIEKLTVVIPWTRLRSESVVVQIRNARLILSDKETALYDVDQEKREERVRKERELTAADEALLLAFKEAQRAAQKAPAVSTTEANGDSSDNNFASRLKASILNNIRVEVEQLFVHYTSSVASAAGNTDSHHGDDVYDFTASQSSQSHDASSPTISLSQPADQNKSVRQASLTFQIQGMKICGCNMRFEPAFVAPGERMSRQLISFCGLAASLRTGARKVVEVPLFRPFNVVLELAYQPVLTDPSTPQYMLAVHMDESCACVITSESCTTCYELLRYLRYVRERQALRRLRPAGERPTAKPRLWWRYVLDASLQQVRRQKSALLNSAHKPTPFSWMTYATTKAKRDRYMGLYLRRQRVALEATRWLEPLTVDEHVEMVVLEDELSTEVLKLAKRLALERVTVERGEYEKLLLRQKEKVAAAANAAGGAASPVVASPASSTAVVLPRASTGGWFSFWRSTPQLEVGSLGGGDGAGGGKVPNDGVDDEARAELRELVQLMTAEKWTDAQRAVIAREFGMSAEEAKELAQTNSGGTTNASSRPHTAPRWVIFVRAVSVSLELRSCRAEAQALHRAAPTQETLAKLLLGKLQGGAEWADGNGGRGDAADTALPTAYYWGSVELLSVSAAKLSSQEQQPGEQEILTIRRTQATSGAGPQAGARQPTSPLVIPRLAGDAVSRHARPFSPLEACWSILSDECRRTAAWQLEWTQRSSAQLTSRTSAVHRAHVCVAPLYLVIDVVPLQHLIDFFFIVMWPDPAAHSSSGSDSDASPAPRVANVSVHASPSASMGDFLTALRIPTSHPLTRIEEHCATDAEARLVILHRKVERQHSIEWDILMDCVTVSLSEIPEVQGCKFVVTKLLLRNDIAHRLQRQERQQARSSKDSAEGDTPPAALGASETDWLDYANIEAASASLSVFLPSTVSNSKNSRTAGGQGTPPTRPRQSVIHMPIFAGIPFAMVVERSLLGRCNPEKPLYKLRISSADAVKLSWSRSTLSVLATSCTTLTDLATSVGETLLQRGGGGASAKASGTDSGSEGVNATFHVGVVPHLSRRELWRRSGVPPAVEATTAAAAAAAAGDGLSSPDVFYKQMHPFSALRLASPGARRRVDVRRGVCVLYHPDRLSSPAEYYTLQRGCTRVRRTDETGSDDGDGDKNASGTYVHLYVLQGGADQEEVLTDAYDAAKQLLLNTVGVPPALLQNAVWLESAVHAWISNQEQTATAGGNVAAESPSIGQVRRALELVMKRTHLVPCRYVAFRCANVEEARAMEAALLHCCVAPPTPPLLLTPAVQAQFNAAVAAPPLRKQPLWSAQLNFPSLQMTCEGREPVAYWDELPRAGPGDQSVPQTAHRDAVLSFTPFSLCYDRFAEKQRFELTVANKTEMYACSPRPTDADNSNNNGSAQGVAAKQPLLKIAPRSAAAGSASLFLRFVTYYRPQPLPSMKRCGIYVGATSSIRVCVGPAMFDWAEAWWDSCGLMTNRLFAEEVIAGYPWWWSPSVAELSQKAKQIEDAWCSEGEYGGNATTVMVDLTAAVLEVVVALPRSAPSSPNGKEEEELTSMSFDKPPLVRVQDESPVFRFAARDASLQWRLTEALNHVHMDLKSPVLQWRPACAASVVEPSVGWVAVMDPATGSSRDGPVAALAVDWKLKKSPPMLSHSDWLCNGSPAETATTAEATAANRTRSVTSPSGFRDSQELTVELSQVTLLYWHPLLLHMIESFQKGVLRRAGTLVDREPCWFHAGVLLCPPLIWPHRGAPPMTDISWDRLRKSFVLRRVVLQIPEDLTWMEQTDRGAPPLALGSVVAMDTFTYADHLRVQPAASAAATSNCQWAAVEQVHVIGLDGVSLQRSATSKQLSPCFLMTLPVAVLTLTFPLFQAASIWKEKEEWHKTFHVSLCSRHNSEASSVPGEDVTATTTSAAAWRGTVADLAFAMKLLHANYVAGSNPPAKLETKVKEPSQQQQHLSTPFKHAVFAVPNQVDTSPASLIKPVAETSTWTLDVGSQLKVCILLADSRTSSCTVEMGCAHVVVDRSRAGELRCKLDASQLLLEGGVQSTDTNTHVPLFSFPTPNVAAPTTSPQLRIQYGWRRLAEGSTAERVIHASVDATHGVGVVANSFALAQVRSVFESPVLRESMNRYAVPETTTTTAAALSGWSKMAVHLQLAQLVLQFPCTSSIGPKGAAAFHHNLQLCVSSSGVVARLRKDTEAWKGMLHVGQLVHCVLRENCDAASAATSAIPLLLQQPAGWSRPVASSPHVSRQTVPSPSQTWRAVPASMDAPKPAQQDTLDELFGELPAPVSPAASALSTAKSGDQLEGNASPQSLTSASNTAGVFLVVELTHSLSKVTFTTTLKPFWLLTPSMTHMSQLLTGLRHLMSSAVGGLSQTGETSGVSAPQQAAPPSVTVAPKRAFSVDVRVGAISVFVMPQEVTMGLLECTTQRVEDAVKHALDCEALWLATEAAVVQWDSELAESKDGVKTTTAAAQPNTETNGGQTVLLLRNISICALRGQQECTVLLDRFSVRVTRQCCDSEAGLPSEEWRLALDPLQLTLTQSHYAALLRVAFQQTSFLATLMSSVSSASQSLPAAAAAETTAGTDTAQSQAVQQASSGGVSRSIRLQLASLSLRVEEDGAGPEASAAHAGSLKAVYVHLRQFNATYHSGVERASTTESVSASYPSGGQLRFVISVQSCLVGTEGAIPTFSLAPPASHAPSPASPFVLHVTEARDATKAKSGVVHVKQVTVTVEAIPVMAWVDLLYAPYLQVAVPNYQTAKELVMQRDLWLTEDLVLTERAPLRAVNSSYSLLYLCGNGRTIYMNAARRGQLILLDEGMTLRITHAVICMEAESIEAYVSAANGSYVVLDRETCTVVRSCDAAAAAREATDNLFSPAASLPPPPPSSCAAPTQLASAAVHWVAFEGDVQVQLRVPEPRTAAVNAGGAQRTLVLYSDMRLSLVRAVSAIPVVWEVSGSFALAHAGIRSEFVTAEGVTVDMADLVSDWALTVQYAEENSFVAGEMESSIGSRTSMQRQLRNIFLDASSGVEVRVRYSDIFFVLRAARHAQTAFAKWKDAMRRDLWSSLAALPRTWNVEEVEGSLVKESLIREKRAPSVGGATAANFVVAAAEEVVTRTLANVQIPYISFCAVDDSRNTETPLFRLYANEICTPNVALDASHVKAELQFTMQLDYYRLSKSQWDPVLDPLRVNLALDWRRNVSVLDVYNRQGYVRLAVQTSSVRSYLTLELLRNLRQLQLLRAHFEAAGMELYKTTEKDGTGAVEKSSTAPVPSFTLLQTTGLDLAVQLPNYVPGSHQNRSTDGEGGGVDVADSGDSSATRSSRVLASGESWAFNLPRPQGKELPRAQQKILVRHFVKSQAANDARGAAVSVASVGVRRVPLSTAGPLLRYIVADVSVSPRQQDQKLIHLHSIILFRNRLNSAVVQLALNVSGTYDAVGVVPAGAAQHVSVEVLRRRVCLALSASAAAPLRGSSSKPPPSYALGPDSVVSLGVSYDALPCLVDKTFLCVASTITEHEDSAARRPVASPSPQTRLAKGKYFDIYSGAADKSYFILRVQAAASQPADVRRYPALAPLRAVEVVAEAVVTIHNAVGLPLTLTLLTRRVRPGMRVGLLDTAPDTAVYTAVSTTTLCANASYGATEMDPFDDICVSVALQQPNGSTLLQWSSQDSGDTRRSTAASGAANAFYPPACVYCSSERGQRDGQLVLADPLTGATLVLYIKYVKRQATLYCPHWIVNETPLALQLADTSSPQVGATERCTNPIAGLGGRTVRTASMAAWDDGAKQVQQQQQQQQTGADTPIYLYNSLRAESCSRSRSNAGSNGLFVRVWETAGSSDAGGQAGFSDWSQQALFIHEAAEVQVVTCASRRTCGAVLVLSCRVELGSQTSLHAYSDTRVMCIRPRWVLVNKSPYTLYFSQSLSNGCNATQRGEGDVAAPAVVCVEPFSEVTVSSLIATGASQLDPLLSFFVSDDAQHNIQRCRWSAPLPINVVHEESTNVVYHSLTPLSEYWPQGSAETPGNSNVAQRIPPCLPPLQPDDIKEVNGELFVSREEAKVFTNTAYAYKGCMMCVEVEEAAQPPILFENRTSYTVCFQQRGVRRVSTVFPRRRKAWTWDAAPSGPSTLAIVELWLAQEQETSDARTPQLSTTKTRAAASASSVARTAVCVLNFDPQQIGQQSRSSDGFQQEIEVADPVRGTSSMLFVRVRGVHGLSYAVSITTEPTIDAYRTLPYPQLSFALQVESLFALLCGEDAQSILLCSVEPLSFAFAQGVRRRKDGAAASDLESADTDVQRLQLRFSTFQVDDERTGAKERVVAQLMDDRESGFQIERKLLRTTPVLYCSIVAFRLTPIELHVEDSFITAMMKYQEVVCSTWNLAWTAASGTATTKRLTSSLPCPPWKADLATALAQTRHVNAELEEEMKNGMSGQGGSRSSRPAAPLWSRVVAIDRLYVDPILVSLSLYRSPGVSDDPLWKIAGAASLLVGSTQDARLQWDAVQHRGVCDTIWHLFFVHRDAYKKQMKKQYMSLVNVMGLDTMRNFVSDLLNAYSDDPRDGSGSNGGRAAERRQKPRVPLRRSAKLCVDQPKEGRARVLRSGDGDAVAATASISPDAEEAEVASISVTAAWLQRVPDRLVPTQAQRAVTVAEVARSYKWSVFQAAAQPAEVRAFGGLALARAIAKMPSTPRHTQWGGEGNARRMSAQEVVTTSAGAARVQCTRCVEVEALRLRRMRDGAATPLPHPVRDGFLTWEEFAHHVGWYEFIDMCSDEEVSKYASMVCDGAGEASSNVCIVPFN